MVTAAVGGPLTMIGSTPSSGAVCAVTPPVSPASSATSHAPQMV